MHNNIKAWIEAMRLRTLPVSVAGVLGGVAVALYYHSFSPLPAAICLVFAIAAQVAANFANEYYDFKAGLDRKGREGFRRGVTEGDISPRAMRNATYGLLIADALLGCSLLFFGAWWLLIAGIFIVIFAMAYSAGPYPLSRHGLGDIAVIFFFGFVPVVLTAYVQMGDIALGLRESWLVGGGVGLLAANVLIVNNYRDADDDRAVGKNTTVVIFGRRAMSIVYLIFGLLAILMLGAAIGHPGFMLGCFSGVGITCVFYLYDSLRRRTGSRLNSLLGATARLLLGAVICLMVLMTIWPAKP